MGGSEGLEDSSELNPKVIARRRCPCEPRKKAEAEEKTDAGGAERERMGGVDLEESDDSRSNGGGLGGGAGVGVGGRELGLMLEVVRDHQVEGDVGKSGERGRKFADL